MANQSACYIVYKNKPYNNAYCQRARRAKTRGWRGGSIIEPCENTVQTEKISSDRAGHVCEARFLKFQWRSEKEVNCLATSSPHGSDRRCNAIFTCFCKFYLYFYFQFYVSVFYLRAIVSGIFIELASSTIGQRVKRAPGHRAKLDQCPKFGQCGKSRQHQRA